MTDPTPTPIPQDAIPAIGAPQPIEGETGEAEPKKKNTLGDYVWEIIQTLVLAGLLIILFRTFVFQNFIVDGTSMVSTLFPNERVIVSRMSYLFGEPGRGDIIVFQYPRDPQRDFVKRIIGLPGETVAINNGQILINGKPLGREDYIDNPSYDSMEPVTLAEDEYFVMGDNRNASSDSRVWGPLPQRNIIGKAWFVYFPFGDWGLVPHVDIEPAS